MSYDKTIKIEDYDIVFEYEYDNYKSRLKLLYWSAYKNNTEIFISDVEESHRIETDLREWLDKEFQKFASDYESNYLDYIADQRNSWDY